MGLLMKCANCDNNAMFEYRITKQESILYCGKCLPSLLNDRKKAGLLAITQQYKDDQASSIKTLAPKKKAAAKKSEQ